MNELTHHGVKGQKWGVRRYQNKDGTLTEKGKKRFAKKANKLVTKAEKTYGKSEAAKRSSEGLRLAADMHPEYGHTFRRSAAYRHEDFVKAYDKANKYVKKLENLKLSHVYNQSKKGKEFMDSFFINNKNIHKYKREYGRNDDGYKYYDIYESEFNKWLFEE